MNRITEKEDDKWPSTVTPTNNYGQLSIQLDIPEPSLLVGR